MPYLVLLVVATFQVLDSVDQEAGMQPLVRVAEQLSLPAPWQSYPSSTIVDSSVEGLALGSGVVQSARV